jgi:uncharacterized protein Yka (UPF0111/DUF47 family)
MLDKYFGFINLSLDTEEAVIEAFIEHTDLDKTEHQHLVAMLRGLYQNSGDLVEVEYGKIRTITLESSAEFEQMAEQIITSDFSANKQARLLTIYTRICNISTAIIACAKRMLILKRIGGTIPASLHPELLEMMGSLETINDRFKDTLSALLGNRKTIATAIHAVKEIEQTVDHQRGECLTHLYQLANTTDIPAGTFRCIENIIEHIETIADTVESATISIEWLLLSE